MFGDYPSWDELWVILGYKPILSIGNAVSNLVTGTQNYCFCIMLRILLDLPFHVTIGVHMHAMLWVFVCVFVCLHSLQGTHKQTVMHLRGQS